MRWFKKLFGGDKITREGENEEHADNHPAAEIAEAERIADEIIKIQVAQDSRPIVSLNSADGGRLMNALNAAISKCPNDADLLYAQASLHYLLLQGEDGNKILERVLALNKDHLDARMKGEHFKSWEMVFNFPGWNEGKLQLPEYMGMHLNLGHTVQVVRNNLRLALSIVVPESKILLQGCRNLRWDLKWVSTPHGKVAAHYLLLDNGQCGEFFIPNFVEQERRILHGHCLLRRLANESYCFVIIARGRTVVRNELYQFPEKLIKTLRQMGEDLEKEGSVSSMVSTQAASKWYMDNSDFSQIRY